MQRVSRFVALAIVVVAFAAAGAACGSSSKTATDASASDATITIHDFKFGTPITVKAGTTVTVKNSDSTEHTVTADDMSFDTGHIKPGATATITVSKAGTIKFHCDIHNYMTGSIHVTA